MRISRQGFQGGDFACKRGRAGRASPPGASAPMRRRGLGDILSFWRMLE
jgi:hypothetical protein